VTLGVRPVKIHLDDVPPAAGPGLTGKARGTRQLGLRTGVDIDVLVAARVIITEGWRAKASTGHISDALSDLGVSLCQRSGGRSAAT
jgi:hypothetical protein